MDFVLLFSIIIIILILTAIIIIKGSRVIPENHCGVVYLFRKHFKTLQPGKYFVFPFVTRVRLVETDVKTSTIENKKVKTKDGLVIGIQSTVKWHVNDPVKALKTADYKKTFEQAVEQAVSQVSKESLLEELNTEYKKTCNFIRENINQIMASWGITAEDVQYEKIAPSFD